MSVKEEKQNIRESIWKLLEERRIARFPLPIRNRIPNFKGSEKAAMRVISHPVFKGAEVIFSCPDSPQRLIREYVLRYGKILIMATPRLREGFLVLSPELIPRGKEREASTIRGAFKYGKRISWVNLEIDLKVAGSVAVTIRGARLGKGGGYSDLEYAILREMGSIKDGTPIITTVHDLQIVDYIPLEEHDVPLDYIFTPTRVININNPIKGKPKGLIPEILDKEKLESIPVLKDVLASKNMLKYFSE